MTSLWPTPDAYHVCKCPRANPAEVCFELRKGHLNRIQVRTVRRQEQEPASGVAHDLGRCCVLVGGQVVQDDHGAGRELWHQHLLDIGGEGGAIHRTFDNPGRNHGPRAETRNEGLRAPCAERGVHDQPLPARRPPARPGQVGFD